MSWNRYLVRKEEKGYKGKYSCCGRETKGFDIKCARSRRITDWIAERHIEKASVRILEKIKCLEIRYHRAIKVKRRNRIYRRVY